MPSIPGKKLQQTHGAFVAPLRGSASFYDGTPGRQLVKCPDCGHNADAMFGDHAGDCLDRTRYPTPNSALGIIRRHAMRSHHLSINDLRPDFDRNAVKESARGPAFAAAVKRGWIEPTGSVPSTGRATKGHRIQTYRSLIHPERTAVEAARADR